LRTCPWRKSVSLGGNAAGDVVRNTLGLAEFPARVPSPKRLTSRFPKTLREESPRLFRFAFPGVGGLAGLARARVGSDLAADDDRAGVHHDPRRIRFRDRQVAPDSLRMGLHRSADGRGAA